MLGMKDVYAININNDMYQPQGVAVHILSDIQDASKVIYINADYWQDNTSMSDIFYNVSVDVLDKNKRYFIDFSNIGDVKKKNQAKQYLIQNTALSLTGDLIVISGFNGELMYTSLSGLYDPNIKILDAYYDLVIVPKLKPKPKTSKAKALTLVDTVSLEMTDKSPSVPTLSFYVNVSHKVNPNDCYINWNTADGKSPANLCKDANISLIYHVKLQRSVTFKNKQGSHTPDAKFVNISIGHVINHSQGAGIHLNNRLYSKLLMSKGISWPSGGPEAEWVSTAIAKSYRFKFSANNKKARVISTIPVSNVNANTNTTITTSRNFGVTSMDPTQILSGNYSHTETRSLSFDVHDYKIMKNSKGERNVSFIWERELYPTAESIRQYSIEGMSATLAYPGDLSKIHPIAYSGFTPSINVNFMASANAKGVTKFNINSAVEVTGFRFRSHILGFFGIRTYYAKDSDSQSLTFAKNVSFLVDWEHPIFMGAKPVNLQVGHFNNKCISIDQNKRVLLTKCNRKDKRQGFIFDRIGRYISLAYNKHCFDGADLTVLKPCSLKQTQKWRWLNKSKSNQVLENQFKADLLAYSQLSSSLRLVDPDNQARDIDPLMITHFMGLFQLPVIKYK